MRPTPRARVAVADVAIVVVDPDPARAALAAPALRMLDELGIPHLIFVNRIDQAHGRIRDLLTALQPMSVSPLIARQIPIREGEKVTGFVDIALERAYHYVPGKPSEADRPSRRSGRARGAGERTQLLEQLADHDDNLLEQLLMDQVPEPGTIFADLKRETSDNLGVSVLFGSATERLGRAAPAEGAPPRSARDPKRPATGWGSRPRPSTRSRSSMAASVGRLALAARSAARFDEGSELRERATSMARLGALFSVQGDKTAKIAERQQWRRDRRRQGRRGQSRANGCRAASCRRRSRSNCRRAIARLAIEPADRKDDVKLSGALARILEEDPSLTLEQDEASHEMRLRGRQ